MTDVTSIDPRTGAVVETVAPETTTEQVDQLAGLRWPPPPAWRRSVVRAGRRPAAGAGRRPAGPTRRCRCGRRPGNRPRHAPGWAVS